ncbi:MAG: ATP-binding protein [Spirochaetes bacterium]|nr:ATP-binding protein [Spirochaetota bacterium]
MVQQQKTHILNESFPSEQGKRKEILDFLCEKISASSPDMAISIEDLYLSLDEAITNAMEHGNGWNPKKKVTVTADIAGRDLLISIADEGKGFDTRDIRANLHNRDILSTRGRGIYIISQFCDISWNSRGNQINLRVKRRT